MNQGHPDKNIGGKELRTIDPLLRIKELEKEVERLKEGVDSFVSLVDLYDSKPQVRYFDELRRLADLLNKGE